MDRTITLSNSGVQTPQPMKIILVGDYKTGKSSYLSKLAKKLGEPFNGDCLQLTYTDNNGSERRVAIHDPTSMERFESLNPSFYRGAVGVILFYNRSLTKSFDNIRSYWLEAIEKCIGIDNIQSMMLLGNSLTTDEAQVENSKEDQLCKDFNININFNISTRTGENVLESWNKLINTIAEDYESSQQSNSISLDMGNIYYTQDEATKPGCCGNIRVFLNVFK